MQKLDALLKGVRAEEGGHDLTDGVVVVTASYPPRFDIDTQRDEVLKYLDEHGYAVVANVANDEQVERAKAFMWDFLEAIPGTNVRRDDVTSWGSSRDWLPSETNGILHGFGFGQSKFMWCLRLLPRVKATFSAIWKTSDLIVSFDGGNVFRPWKYNRSWFTAGGWYHVDQNGLKFDSAGKVCVQGLVTLFDVTEDTGGLVVVPGSHKQHTAMCERSTIAKSMGDFVPVPVDDPVLSEGANLVCAQAGDLVLWDSRTVHCNTPALAALTGHVQKGEGQPLRAVDEPVTVDPDAGKTTTSDPEWELIRQVGYVCMTPARFASNLVLLQRQDAFVHSVSTSHWPHKFVMGDHLAMGLAISDDGHKSGHRKRGRQHVASSEHCQCTSDPVLHPERATAGATVSV